MKQRKPPHNKSVRQIVPAVEQLVRIEKPIYGGSFLARVEGKAVFVPLVLPEEQVRIRITQSKSGYATADPVEVIGASGNRISPLCQHFGVCGGCSYQHTDYASQLAFKQAILRETLQRGGVDVPAEIAVLAAEPWGYRNRIRLAFDEQRKMGYRGRRSHAIVPVQECPIAAPVLMKAALLFAEHLHPLRPVELTLFCNAEETAIQASIVVADSSVGKLNSVTQKLYDLFPALCGLEFLNQNSPPKVITRNGESSLTYCAVHTNYRVDQGAFFQVNRYLVDRLAECVVGDRVGALAWDLFAGVGLFARQLAARFSKIIAVESASSAADALVHNLQGCNARAIDVDTLTFLRRQHRETPDLIVVDPPRAGLGTEITSLLGQIAAPEIVYVSCDPATLARDLQALLASGYQIQSITLVDLFPQTFHLETVVSLKR